MRTTRIKSVLGGVAVGNYAGAVRGAALGTEDSASVSLFTDCAAIIFTVAIVAVFALELAAARRDRRATLRVRPDVKPVRPPLIVEDDDGRTRVLERV